MNDLCGFGARGASACKLEYGRPIPMSLIDDCIEATNSQCAWRACCAGSDSYLGYYQWKRLCTSARVAEVGGRGLTVQFSTIPRV